MLGHVQLQLIRSAVRALHHNKTGARLTLKLCTGEDHVVVLKSHRLFTSFHLSVFAKSLRICFNLIFNVGCKMIIFSL